MMNAMPPPPQQMPPPQHMPPYPQQMPGVMRPPFPYAGQPPLPLLQQPYDPVVNRVQNRAILSRDDFGLLETRHPPKERTLDQIVGQVADQVARNQLTSYEMYRLTPVEDEKDGDGKDGSAGKMIRALGKKKTWLRVLVVQQLIPQDAIAEAIQELEEEGRMVAEKMKELGTNQQVQISNILNDNIQSKMNSHFVWQIAQLGFQFERNWGKKTMSSITLYLKHTPRPDVEGVAIIRQREQAKLQQARQSLGFAPQQIPRPGVSFGPPQMQGQPISPPPMVRKADPPPVVPARGIRVPTSDSTDSSYDSRDSASTPPSISTRPSTVSTGQSRRSRSSRSRRSTKSGSRGHARSRSRERISLDRRGSYSPPRSRDYVVVQRHEKHRNSSPRRRSSSPYSSRLPRRPWPENDFYEHGGLVDRFGRTSNRSLRTDSPWPHFNHRRDAYGDAPSLSGSTLRGSTVPSSSMSGSARVRSDGYGPSRSSRESGDERRRRYEEEERRDMIERMVEDELQELHRQRVREAQRPAPFQEFTRKVHIRDMEGRVPQDYLPDRRHSPISNRGDYYMSDSEDELYYRRDDPDHFRPRREHHPSRLDGEEYDFIGRDEANPFRHTVRDELNQFRPRRELHKTRPHAGDDEYDFIGRDEVNPFRRPVASTQQPEHAPRSDTPKSILKVSKQSEHKIRPPINSPNHIQPSPLPPEQSATQDLSARERLSLPAIITVYSQAPTQPLPEGALASSHAQSSPRPSKPSNNCREVVLYKPSPKPRRQKQRARFEDMVEKRPRRVSFQTEDQSGVHMWGRTPPVRKTSRPHTIVHNSTPPVLQHRKPNPTLSESAALASGREQTLYSASGLKRRKATWTTPPHDAHPISSWPLNSVTVGSFTNSSATSFRYRPTTTFFPSQPSTQEPCHCQTDGGDGVPPHENSTSPSTHSKAIGYCFTLCLFLFLIIGIFAACVQAIAVFLLLEEQASVDFKPPTWRDNDYFQMLSGSCWQILGMAFTLLITLKHTSEHNDHRSWIFPWFVGFVCVLSSAFAMGLYVRSPAWSLATSGFSSLAQVSVHFLTIRMLEKTEIREKITLQWQARDKVDEDLEQHKVKCRIRKAELDHEMLSHERSLEARRATLLRDFERQEMNCRLTRQRLAGEEAERRKKVMDEIIQLERQKTVLELDLQRGRRLRPPGSDSGYGSASISGASVTDDARSTGGDSSDDRCEMRGGTTPDMVGAETFGAGIRVYAVNV